MDRRGSARGDAPERHIADRAADRPRGCGSSRHTSDSGSSDRGSGRGRRSRRVDRAGYSGGSGGRRNCGRGGSGTPHSGQSRRRGLPCGNRWRRRRSYTCSNNTPTFYHDDVLVSRHLSHDHGGPPPAPDPRLDDASGRVVSCGERKGCDSRRRRKSSEDWRRCYCCCCGGGHGCKCHMRGAPPFLQQAKRHLRCLDRPQTPCAGVLRKEWTAGISKLVELYVQAPAGRLCAHNDTGVQ